MKRALAMLLAALMVLSLLPAQVFADETVPGETVTVVEEAPEQTVAETAAEVTEEETSTEETAEVVEEETTAATEETVEEEPTAATEETVAEETVTVTDEAVNEAAEDIPDPVLTYWFLQNHNDEWSQQDWDMSWNNGKFGWEHTTQAPGESWMIFYLNTWNTETESWDYTPVHVGFGEHLSGQLLAEGDYAFAADAVDTGYYYRVSISESGWDQTTGITYEYEGETLEIGVDIKRHEDGWYTSTTMSNDTYICQNYRYSQISPEKNVFYFGFDSDYWTVVGDVDFSVENVPINGYDQADAIKVTKLNSNQYKIALDPFPVAANVSFEVIAKLTVQDSDGNTEEWGPRIWVESRYQEGQFAGMEINRTWTRFEEEDGVTKAMAHTPTDYTYAWGDQVFVYAPAELPEGFSYDLSTNTLTLNKATLESLNVNYTWYDERTGDSGTNLPNENLTIELLGTSTIAGSHELIVLSGDLKTTFTGGGTLNFNAVCTDHEVYPAVINLHHNAEVIIDGVKVNVTAKLDCDSQDGWPHVVSVDRGCHLIVNSGELNVDAQEYRVALLLNGDYTQNGGEVNVSNTNSDDGFIIEDGVPVGQHVSYGVSSKGYTTINGGKLTAEGYVGMEIGYDAGDINNPDWPAQPNTKFTLNEGTVEAKGILRGAEVYAPAELKGGSMNAANVGIKNPMNGLTVGQGLCLWYNGSEDVASCLEISGGQHSFIGATGENYNSCGMLCDTGNIKFTGGTTTIKGTIGIVGQSTLADNKQPVTVAEEMHIVDLTTDALKSLLYGEYYFAEENLTFYSAGIETDDTFNAQEWWDGVADECSDVMITVHLEETIPGHEGSCTEDGLTDGKKCTICGEITVEQETIEAPGHTYDNDEDTDCNACGQQRPEVQYHDPVLTYHFLHCPVDNSWTLQDWDPEWNDGKYGWEQTRRAPGGSWMVFYLNTWNVETQSWEHEPVHVNFGEYLSGQLLVDGDYGFMPGAQDTDYYYHIDISEEGWDKTTYITYEHEGETLAVTVEIARNEDGWYTSSIMRNDTYICEGYHYSQLKPDSNVIYFGFQSTHWTLESADIAVEHVPINGYDPADAITVRKLSNNMYQVILDPFLVAANVHFDIVARIIVSDSEGNREEWEPRVWANSGERDYPLYGMEINHQWTQFAFEDGNTYAMTHTESDYTYEWGDTVYLFQLVDLPEGLSYDAATNTLTLNKTKLDSLKVFYSWYNEENGESGGNLPNENLTVKLIGTSTIQGQQELLGFGDDIKATLTGTGTLNLNGKCTDPEAWPVVLNLHNGAELTLDGPTVNVNGEVAFEAQDGWPIALNVDRGCHLIVNKGKLNVNAKNYNSAVMLNGDYTQNGGEVTVISDNEHAGFFYDEQNRLNNFVVYAMSSKGYTTINGGKLTLDGYFGLEIGYDAGDINNPDWPAQPNTKFTLNDGTVDVKGVFRGVEVYAPAELKGGSMNASIESILNPMVNINIGQALCIWDNGSEEVKAYMEISGGNHTFTAPVGENTIDYGAVADSADIIFTGGTTTFKGVKAIAGQSMLEDNKDLLEVAEDMHIYDMSAKICKEILSGEYLLVEDDFQQMFYINSIETDDTFDAQKWWDGEADECSDIMITVHLEETIPGKEATCTETGLTSGKKCSICGEILMKQETIKVKDHTEETIQGKEATCTETGLTDGKKCSVCGKILVEQKTVKAKGHTEKTIKGKPATCTETGLTDGKKCSVCGTVTVKQKVIEAKGHTYTDGQDATCNVCGEERLISVPMYRMYDPNSGEHFYSGSELERDFLVEAGWHYEGVGFNFPVEGDPVHRLYDPEFGEHLYTMDEEEMNMLLDKGWNYEGVAFNSAGSDEVPQYRLHNPNAKRGGYHFTGSEVERDLLISFGWEYEGIGWYSCVE